MKVIGAQFWLGLTATPARRDGLGELVTWQLGPVRHTIDPTDHPTDHSIGRTQRAGIPGQEMLTVPGEPAPGPRRLLFVHETTFRHDDIDPTSPSALAAVHRTLIEDEERNNQIITDLSAALARSRNCLVLTRRVAHVATLTTLLANRGHQALILQGGMSAKDRRATIARLDDTKSGDAIAVVGTTPFIGEGFDAPALDTLFLAGPISFDGLLIQCAGRIIRAAPGKDVAEVHDYHDASTPILAASLNRRMPGYRILGFTRS